MSLDTLLKMIALRFLADEHFVLASREVSLHSPTLPMLPLIIELGPTKRKLV